MSARRVPDAHDNIQPIHPDTSGAVCATCHARENAELLALIGGRRAAMDQGVACAVPLHAGRGVGRRRYGKRLDGWQAGESSWPAACHDPHHCVVEPRIPSVPPFSSGSGATP
jgi:hypothetical protein